MIPGKTGFLAVRSWQAMSPTWCEMTSSASQMDMRERHTAVVNGACRTFPYKHFSEILIDFCEQNPREDLRQGQRCAARRTDQDG